MANAGGFLQALGGFFGGMAQDQQTRLARQQALQRLGIEQRAADDAHTSALLERATNYPLVSSGTSTTFGTDGLPTGSVDVPGYGTVDPFGKLRLGLMADRIKRQQETDEKIRESSATGATDKNKAETAKATVEADPGFYGKRAGAEAAARAPFEQQLEGLRSRLSLGNQLQLQGNQQQFEQGQQGRQFEFNRDQALAQLRGNFLNRSAEINQQQRGGLIGRLMAPPASTNAPSDAMTTNALPRLTPEQVVRAANDPSYRAFKESQGYQFGGGRP